MSGLYGLNIVPSGAGGPHIDSCGKCREWKVHVAMKTDHSIYLPFPSISVVTLLRMEWKDLINRIPLFQ